MKLSDRQKRFAFNFFLLQKFLYEYYPEIEIVFGEAQRTVYQQKEYLRLGLSETPDSEHLIKCAGSDESVEAIRAFMGKRKPVFHQ